MAQDTQPETEATTTPTPLRAVRLACLECCSGSALEVRECVATSCPLWTFRFGRRPSIEDKAAVAGAGRPVYPIEKRLTGASRLKAIRRKCIDCSGGTDGAVRACTVSACPLFQYRLGRNPNIVRSPERKEADTKRLALLRASVLPPRPAGNPEIAAAQVLEGERATRQAAELKWPLPAASGGRRGQDWTGTRTTHMATRTTIERIARQIDKLAATHEAATHVPLYDDETEAEALEAYGQRPPAAWSSTELVQAIDGRTANAAEWMLLYRLGPSDVRRLLAQIDGTDAWNTDHHATCYPVEKEATA